MIADCTDSADYNLYKPYNMDTFWSICYQFVLICEICAVTCVMRSTGGVTCAFGFDEPLELQAFRTKINE